MRQAFLDVLEFDRARGKQPSMMEPSVPELNEYKLRLRLLDEEFSELWNAIRGVSGAPLKEPIETYELVGLNEVADAMVDLIWVIIGTATEFGINLPAVWEKVREANMEKFGQGAYTDPGGKVMKPPGWTHPDIAGLIASQKPLAEIYALRATQERLAEEQI